MPIYVYVCVGEHMSVSAFVYSLTISIIEALGRKREVCICPYMCMCVYLFIHVSAYIGIYVCVYVYKWCM
jgi:hypothetical protein